MSNHIKCIPKFEKNGKWFKKCIKCKQIKTIDNFIEDHRRLDGFRGRCSNCGDYTIKPKRRLQIEIDKENGYKICSWCKEKKDLNSFLFIPSINKYNAHCKLCRYNKEHRVRKNSIYEENGKLVRNCSNCNEIKEVSLFRKSKRISSGIIGVCNICANKSNLEYNNKNRKKRRSVVNKSYRKRRKQILQNQKERLKTDIHYKMMLNFRNRMRLAIRDGVKCQHTMELIGMTLSEYKIYLESLFESGMSWNNYSKKSDGWVVDHILPCELFDLSMPKHQKYCFNYKNTRPLWNIDNVIKQDFLPDGRQARKLSPQEKKEYLISLGLGYLYD